MQTGANLSTLVDGWLEAGRSDHTALVTADDRRWSAGDLHAAMCRVAGRLRDGGVRPGDRLLLVLDDTPAFPAAFLGAIRCGAIPIPSNVTLRSDDFGYFVDDAGAVAVVVDAAFVDRVGPPMSDRPGTLLIVANGSAPAGSESLDAWMSDGPREFSPVPTRADAIAFWLYSSGSTGRPKGVPHRHGDVAGTCRSYAEPVLGIGPDDIVFSTTKMFHAYGLGNSLSFPLWAGATAVYLTGRPTPDRLLERVRAHRPTLFFSVPALYAALLAHPELDHTSWSSVRLGISAAEALPPDIWRRFQEQTGIEILDGVGSTEMLHIYCSNRPGTVKPGTSGTPCGGYAVEIRDPDGVPCQPGQAGEMWVRGPSAPTGYWNQPERTRDKIRGDWFLSGDRYQEDEDGYFVYQGRVDDMMKIGGLWVSPIAIENRLVEHPAVSEAAVVSTEIDYRSRIKAFVIPTTAAATGKNQLVGELQDWCKEKLRRFECPHVIEFVDDLPRTATGKVQRFKLRDG